MFRKKIFKRRFLSVTCCFLQILVRKKFTLYKHIIYMMHSFKNFPLFMLNFR
jgi:hypothetical protein